MLKSEIASEIIELSRNALMMDIRFMDAALFELAPIPSSGVGLMTDGQFLYYDEDLIINTFKEEKTAVSRAILHMVLHMIFSHSFVGKQIDREKWDLACDMAVEHVINEANINCIHTKRQALQAEKLAEFGKGLKSYTAERLYSRLMNTEDITDLKTLFFTDSHDKWYKKEEPPLHRGTGTGKNVKKDYKNSEATSNSDKPFETRNSIAGRWKKLAEGIQVELETRAKRVGRQNGQYDTDFKCTAP